MFALTHPYKQKWAKYTFLKKKINKYIHFKFWERTAIHCWIDLFGQNWLVFNRQITPALSHLPSRWQSWVCSCETQTEESGRRKTPENCGFPLLSLAGWWWCWWQSSSSGSSQGWSCSSRQTSWTFLQCSWCTDMHKNISNISTLCIFHLSLTLTNIHAYQRGMGPCWRLVAWLRSHRRW